MSNLFDQISEDIQKAMLAHDHVRTETLRGVKKEFLEAKTAKGAEGELTEYIRALIEKLGVTDMKGMGRIMGTATKELAGKAQGGDISRIVKQLLSGK